jgi:hypothetical protein
MFGNLLEFLMTKKELKIQYLLHLMSKSLFIKSYSQRAFQQYQEHTQIFSF